MFVHSDRIPPASPPPPERFEITDTPDGQPVTWLSSGPRVG